eukprot:SAG11_NODE_1683_length_4450_cov_2.569984_2_plen_82_part_00
MCSAYPSENALPAKVTVAEAVPVATAKEVKLDPAKTVAKPTGRRGARAGAAPRVPGAGLPYDLGSLSWNQWHTRNEEGKYS